MNAKILNGLLVIVAFAALMGCNVNYEAPHDEAGEACRDGKIGTIADRKTDISCEALEENGMVKQLVPVAGRAENWKGVVTVGGAKYLEMTAPAVLPKPMTPDTLPGLVVVVEVGTFEANKANVAISSFGGMMNDQIPQGLRDNIRMFMSNFTKAFLEETIDRVGKKYDHIYYVKGDTKLKQIFLQTLKKATNAHPKVDLLIVSHGASGEMLLNPELKSGPDSLSGKELIKFANDEMSEGRKKIRAIFQTNCFVFSSPNDGPSIYKAYGDAFPNAVYYGGLAVNSFPLHRDIVAFEKYYEFLNTSTPKPFSTAVTFAKNFIYFRLDGTTPRHSIVFPAIKGRGCVTILGFDKCMVMAQPTANIPLTNSLKTNHEGQLAEFHIADSEPILGGEQNE